MSASGPEAASGWSSERWLHEVLRSLPVIVWSVDREGRISHSAGAALAALGFGEGDLVGRPLSEIVPDRPEVLHDVECVLAGEALSIRLLEWRGRRYETRYSPRVAPDGTIVGVMAISIDVSERARDVSELERRSRLLHAVATVGQRFLSGQRFEGVVRRILETLGRAVDGSRVEVFENRVGDSGELIADLRWEWVAEQVEPRIGDPALSGLALLGEPLQELAVPLAWGEPVAGTDSAFSPRLAGFLAAQEARSLLAVPVFVGERWWGFLAFVDCRAERSWSAEEVGALRAATALFGAAWERARVETELRESEEKYRELVENATDFVWSIDLDGYFLSANRAMAARFGFPVEELVGRHWESLIPEESQREIVRRAMREKSEDPARRTSYEVRMATQSGALLQVEVSSRIVLHDGEPVAIHGTGRDVTERRQLEEQLRQAVKLEAIGRLAGGVAHDFNNLLTAINGYGERVLARLRPSDPMRGEVMEILKAGERAADLTRELMAFSRQQPAMPRQLDLNGLVEQRLGMLRRIVGDDVVVVNLAEARIGSVVADPALVEQVLVNLMVNARDAMPAGGRIEIATAPADAEEIFRRGIAKVPRRPFVRLSVRDTGEGMDADTMAHIFEPFFTTKEMGKGSGLGLSTVYGIVKQCGGYIFADSHPGQGTVFHVFFPQAAPSPEAAAAAAPSTAPPERETILLVEDEDLIRNLAHQILVDRGYRVLPAANANEALEISVRHARQIDLLLTDIVMPGTSGSDLAQRLLRDFPRLPVLYMSGYSDSLIFRSGLLQDRAAFLQKPFSADILERKIRELLDA